MRSILTPRRRWSAWRLRWLFSSAAPCASRQAAIAGQARFQAVPGIGKRTAERIVELREKVGDAAPAGPTVATAARGPTALARDGLIELGYVLRARRREPLRGAGREQSAEDLIAEALRMRGHRRRHGCDAVRPTGPNSTP